MPTLKMYISGELVDTLLISFVGLEHDEKPAHIEGLSQWLKKKNYVAPGLSFEIFLEGVESAANDLIRDESEITQVAKAAKKPTAKSNKAKRNYTKPRNITKKETGCSDDVKQPFVRAKADHTNKNWWDE